MSLPPIRRNVTVSWGADTAFRRFTQEFGKWWPAMSHSVGGTCVARIVFECRAGGSIFEEHVDGRRFGWGRVLEFEPPSRVKFTWHPSREAAAAQEVEVTFTPGADGTRVELVSDKWERWGKNAHRARKGYDVGWGYLLNLWAGRRTASMAVLDGVTWVLRGVEFLRGGEAASIARAGGELPRATMQ
jgi:uncharacterized protein YndB with AHSA1/START domain